MFNLIIIGNASRQSLREFELVDQSRFGEYSSKEFFDPRTQRVSDEILEKTLEFPTIIATEERDGDAYIGQLDDARLGTGRIIIDFKWRNRIPYDLLRTYQKQLGIADFEFSRNHWAVKNIDLNDIEAFRLALSAGVLSPALSVEKQGQPIQLLSVCNLALSACRDRYALMNTHIPNEQVELEAHQIEIQCLDSLIYSLETFLAIDHLSNDQLIDHGNKFAKQIVNCLIALSNTKNGERIANTAIGAILLGISSAFSNYVATEVSTPLLFASTFGPQVISSLNK
ncbi:hypothetical protein [Thalassospira sp.]|uniref:hypothetical protein n=1 Tax=Thalassospira sp. TaxID=1912094 RepID=UPI000C3E32AA|nr:hypothetical protein [Thalassospira sp.]MAL38883.1 hypothetical protein [Thalassospira sp.]MAL42131.1 hypothetical protein [Thalassospira sp.]|tara:strand:- start:389 stop:1240 length:852 start_codon:yes stop_codon:yes gene_type:complete